MLPSWYNAQFPEALYPPIVNQDQYAARVISGGVVASGTSLGVVGLARDNVDVIGYTLSRILHLSHFFKSVKCLIFENDSIDGTPDYINKFMKNQNRVEFHLASAQIGRVRHSPVKSRERRADMAMYRNGYLSLIERMNWDVDYLMVIDTDLVGGFSYEGILNTLGQEEDWTAVGSNGITYRYNDKSKLEKLFFDTWAYRPFNCWNDVCGEETNLLSFERSQPLVPVFSCFGGMAIYKYDRIKGLRYTDEDCDHVTLHKQIIDMGQKIYLNPSQITIYTKHQYVL